MKLKYFEVKGKGKFPLDMLRYDACWPRTSEDVEAIDMAPEDQHKERTIRLSTPITSGPSHARWSSMMWAVVNESKPVNV